MTSNDANELLIDHRPSNRTHAPVVALNVVAHVAIVEVDAPRLVGIDGEGGRRPEDGLSSTTARIHRTIRFAPGVEFSGNRRTEVLVVHDALQLLHIRHPPAAARVVGRVQAGNEVKRVIPGEYAVLIEVVRVASGIATDSACSQ